MEEVVTVLGPIPASELGFTSMHEHVLYDGTVYFNRTEGKFPDYIRFGLGGSGTLRGFSSGEFRGAHRWIQTLEWRISPFPKWFFGVPFVGRVDVQVGTVFFMDTGIVWRHQEDFRFERFHGGGGCGLRIYSPAQDVVRLDFGFNAQGDVHLYFSTGIRF